MQEPWNFDSVAIKEVQDLKQKIHALDCELNQYVKDIKALINSNNKLKENLTTLVNYSMQTIEQFKCSCANILNETINAAEIGFVDAVGKRISTKFPLGGSNIQDAMHDFEYAKKNPHAEILNSRKEITDDSLNIPLDRAKVPQNMKGVVYKPESLQSQKIFHSRIVQNYIEENLEALIDADGKPLKDADLGYTFYPETDAYLAIQHFILHNPRITKDGYFKADLVDYFDFEKRKMEEITDVVKVPLNNTGHSMQEIGILQNYFEIYNIKKKLW